MRSANLHVMADLLRKMAVRMLGPNELGIRQSTGSRCMPCRPAQKTQKPKRQCSLATADDIRDAAAQWSLALRRIAMIEPTMGADLKRGG